MLGGSTCCTCAYDVQVCPKHSEGIHISRVSTQVNYMQSQRYGILVLVTPYFSHPYRQDEGSGIAIVNLVPEHAYHTTALHKRDTMSCQT
jgi:hypothetical protein